MAGTTMKQKLEFLDLDDLNAPDRQRLEDLFAADNPHVELLAPSDYLATGGWFGGISGSVNGHQSVPCEVYQESVEVSQDLATPPTDLARDNLSSAAVTPDHATSQGDNVYGGEDEHIDEPTDDISDIPKPGSHFNSALDNNIATPLASHPTQTQEPNSVTFINTPTAAAATNFTPPSSYTSATSPTIPYPKACSNNSMDGVPAVGDTPREYNVPPPHILQHGEGGVQSHGSSHGNHPSSTHVLQPTAPVYSPQQPYPALAASPNAAIATPTVFNPHVLPPPPPSHHQSPAAAPAATPYGQMTHQIMQAPPGPTVYVQNCHVNVSPYGATSVHNQNVHNQHAGHGPTAASVQNQQVHQHAVHNQYNVHQHIAAAAAAQAGGPVAAHNSHSPGPVVSGQVMPPMAMVHDPTSHMQHGMKPLHDKGDYDGSKQQQQQQQRFEQQTYYRGGYGGGRGGRGRGRGGGRGGRGRGQPIPHHERSNSVSSDHSAYGSEKGYQETSPTPYTGMPQSQFVPNPYAHMYMPRTPYPHPYGAAAGHMAAAAAASQNVQGLPLIYHQQQYQQQQQQQQQFLAHYQQSPHNQGQLVTYTPVSSQGNVGPILHHSQQQQQLQQQHQVPTSHIAPQLPHYHPSVQHHYQQQQVPAAALPSPEQPFQPPPPQPTQPLVPVAVVSRPTDPADNTKIHCVSEAPQGTDVTAIDPVELDEPVTSNSEVYEVIEEPQIENLSKDVGNLTLKEEIQENSEKISDNIPVKNAVSFQPTNNVISKDIDVSKDDIEQTDSIILESAVPTSAVSIAPPPAVIIVGNPVLESLDMSNCSLGKVEFKNGSFSNTTDLGLSFTVDDEIFPLDSNSMETSMNIDCTNPAVELPSVKPPPPPAVELPMATPKVVVQTTQVAVEMPKTAIHSVNFNSMKDAIPAVEDVVKKSSPSISPIMIIPEPTKAVSHPTKALDTILVSGPVDITAAQLSSASLAAPVSISDKSPASGIVSGSEPGLSIASPTLPLPQDDAAVPPPVPVGAWAQKKSWSDLFTKKMEDGTAKQVAYVAPFNQQQEAAAVAANAASDSLQEQSLDGTTVSVPSPSAITNNPLPQESSKMILPPVAEEDIEKAKMGEMLRQYQQDHHHAALQPRGLINKGYWCYVNAPLQALLACPPFYNLLTSIPTISGLKKGKSTTPVIDSITEYVHEFSEMNQMLKPSKKDKDPKGVRKEPELVCGSPFEPVYVYKLLSTLSGEMFTEGRQQDAEEMLSAVLNGLHDEMVEALKLAGEDFSSSGSVGGLNGDISDHEELSDNNDDDEWQVMGPKKRSVITRTAHFTPSPISNIFWGMMRSNLQQAGGQVTANLQPFTTLPLDIQSPNVETVRDALDQLVSREDVSGYTCSKTNQEVAVSKQVVFEHLPNVMILQLKRFIYDKDGGLQKVSKKVGFPLNLEITKELMSSNSRGKYSSTQRKFKLLGVIYHDGKEATKGHYVADIYHSGYNCWLRYDDSVVKVVAEQQMLKHVPPRVPYMLFYRRQDTMVGPTTKIKA